MTEVEFSGLSLLSAPGRVMTPRPASERVVASAVAALGGRPGRVVDVGTGSGAIAIAVAARVPGAEVWATDTCRAAVALARANVRRHGLEARVRVVRGDLLAAVPAPLDVVVANLPYLPAAEAGRRPDLEDEPPGAVYAPGDGLGPYRRLVQAARAHLAPEGRLIVQLHRRVVAASRAELEELRAALGAEPCAVAEPG